MAYRIDETSRFLRIVFSAAVTTRDLWAALRRIEALETARSATPDRLIDLTGIETSTVAAEDVRSLADRRRGHHFPNAFRCAIVATRPAHFGFARMFQILNRNPEVTIQVFSDTPGALQWLAASAAAAAATEHLR